MRANVVKEVNACVSVATVLSCSTNVVAQERKEAPLSAVLSKGKEWI
jgi:hypothetical protein